MRYVLVLTSILLGLLAGASADDDAGYVPGQICCFLREGADIDTVNARWGTVTLDDESGADFYLLFAAGVDDLEAFADSLGQDPDVVAAEVNYRLETPEAVRQMVIGAVGGTWDDFQDQSLTQRIGLDLAHTMSTGAGVIVAVLDTGIDPDHDAFAGRLVEARFDCVDHDHEPWEVADGVDEDGDGFIDEGYGHGTMVAGLVVLVAPGAMIMPVRVLDDEGRGNSFDITQGMMKAISHGASIINMSFGAPHIISTVQQKLHVASVHGAVTFAGAGNRNREEPPYYPASDSLAFMVTALDSLDVKADFADYHRRVLVSAPGVGVRSTYPGNDWGIGSGCSFATPLVSGEAALVRSLEPGMGRAEMGMALQAGVDPIYGIPGNELYLARLGTGRISLPGALWNLLPESAAGPSALLSARAWPNPSPGVIHFTAPGVDGPLNARIYDAGGRLLESLAAPRGGSLTWDARTAGGRPLPAGSYWVRLTAAPGRRVLSLRVLR
jgi:subtilisin family serine protease